MEAEGGDPAADPLLRVEHYERTPEQAAAIGLLPPEGPQVCTTPFLLPNKSLCGKASPCLFLLLLLGICVTYVSIHVRAVAVQVFLL